MGISSSNYHFLLVSFHLLASFWTSYCSANNDDIPLVFVFGDSLVDVGNNNYIVSLAKSNFLPYGIDFGKPTGRFTNGRTVLDSVGQELGLKSFVPPYLDQSTVVGGVDFHGVNYASAGSGILNKTGYLVVGRINMDAQFDNFANTRQDIISRIGLTGSELLGKAIFILEIGSNDCLFNYLTPVLSIPKQKLVTPEMFVDTMISSYRLQLTRLYNLDARKIVVANIGPIGCIPYQRELNPSPGESCITSSNDLAMLFNNRLKSLIIELNSNLVGSKFLYGDVYHIVSDIVQNFQSYGFENYNSACCSLAGRFGGLAPCIQTSKVCTDRSKYVFWDAFHPSEAANVIIAKRLYDGDTNDIYPINIRKLSEA